MSRRATASRKPFASGWFGGTLLMLLASACTNSGTLGTGSSVTALRVEPRIFPDSLECNPRAAGALHAYVATLTDITRLPTVRFDLPSSPPTPCGSALEFTTVAPGNLYLATVEGYDRSDLRAAAPGSRAMVDTSGGSPVQPRWRFHCSASVGEPGDLDAAVPPESDAFQQLPVLSRSGRIVPFAGCRGLHTLAPADLETALIFDPAALGLEAACETLRVEWFPAEGPGSPSAQEGACDGPLLLPVEADRLYRVLAFPMTGDAGISDGGVADYECVGRTRAGEQTPVSCN